MNKKMAGNRWKIGYDKNSGRDYYYNPSTGETTWTKPPELMEPDEYAGKCIIR